MPAQYTSATVLVFAGAPSVRDLLQTFRDGVYVPRDELPRCIDWDQTQIDLTEDKNECHNIASPPSTQQYTAELFSTATSKNVGCHSDGSFEEKTPTESSQQLLQDTQIEQSLAAGDVDFIMEEHCHQVQEQVVDPDTTDADIIVDFPIATQQSHFSQQLAHLWQASCAPVLCPATPQSQPQSSGVSPSQRQHDEGTANHSVPSAAETPCEQPDCTQTSVDDSGSSASESMKMPSPSQNATQRENPIGCGFRSPRCKRRRLISTPTHASALVHAVSEQDVARDPLDHGKTSGCQNRDRVSVSAPDTALSPSPSPHEKHLRDIHSSFENSSTGDDFLALSPQHQDPRSMLHLQSPSQAKSLGGNARNKAAIPATHVSNGNEGRPVTQVPNQSWVPSSRTLTTLARQMALFQTADSTDASARVSTTPHATQTPFTAPSAATAAILGVVIQVDPPRSVKTRYGMCPVASIRLSDPSTPATLLLTVWGSRARSTTVARLTLGNIVHVGGFRLSTYHGAVGANLSSTKGWLRVLQPSPEGHSGAILADETTTGPPAWAEPWQTGEADTSMRRLLADVDAISRWKAVRYPWISPGGSGMLAIKYCTSQNLEEFQLVHFRGIVRSAIVCREPDVPTHMNSHHQHGKVSASTTTVSSPVCTLTLVDSNGGISVDVLLAHAVLELSKTSGQDIRRRKRAWQFRLQSDSTVALPVPQIGDVVDITHVRVCRRRHTHALEMHATTFTKCTILSKEDPMACHLRMQCQSDRMHHDNGRTPAPNNTDEVLLPLRELASVANGGVYAAQVHVLEIQFGDHVTVALDAVRQQLVARRMQNASSPLPDGDISMLFQHEVLFTACVVCHKELKQSANGIAIPFSCGGSDCYQTVDRVLTGTVMDPMRLTVVPLGVPLDGQVQDNRVVLPVPELHAPGVSASTSTQRQGSARTWHCLRGALRHSHGTETKEATARRYSELDGTTVVRACAELLKAPCTVVTVACAVVRDDNGFEQQRTLSLMRARPLAGSIEPETTH
eukprot:m.1180053 g.1180053  ORF g.1180053 m.1180053 type:complete len:1019 (-) comp24531_c0_seq1:4240-7296(-)